MAIAATLSSSSRRAPNDNLSAILDDLVPGHLDGTDRFLDVATWNIRYFNSRDPERVETITRIMQEINADVYVLQEIEDGSLSEVTHTLVRSGAGLYAAEYGKTGGRNRVGFLIDTEWVRNTTEISELFAGEQSFIPETHKNVFPRLPLYGEFIVRSDGEAFNVNVVGVHLKSCRTSSRDDGTEQRRVAAARLSRWLRRETNGEDVVVAGDWNAGLTRPEWSSLTDLEQGWDIYVRGWNPGGELSHVIARKSPQMDVIVLTPSGPETPAVDEIEGCRTTVLGWRDDMFSRSVIAEMKLKVSDYLPVVSRMIFRP